MFQAAQGSGGLIWTNKERAVLQAFLTHYKGKEGANVSILEAVEGDRFAGGLGMFSEGTGLGEGTNGA